MKAVIVFTVSRKNLEKSLEYLACPKDKGDLKLESSPGDQIREGLLICKECRESYLILDGIPYFGIKNGYEWRPQTSKAEIIKGILDTIDDRQLSWRKILSLPNYFVSRGLSRKESIDSIFEITTRVIAAGDLDVQGAAYLMQAATEGRYEIETYRGTFMLPESIMNGIKSMSKRGMVYEGACATGESIYGLSNQLRPDFSIGLDIAGALLKQAASRNPLENGIYVQGDICALPFRKGCVDLAVLNNVFDRVTNPVKACQEVDYSAVQNGSLFALSNCDPLQYEYSAESGKVLFVPEQNQISLEEGLKRAGFRQDKCYQSGKDDGWKISTVAFGDETLPFKSLLGVR